MMNLREKDFEEEVKFRTSSYLYLVQTTENTDTDYSENFITESQMDEILFFKSSGCYGSGRCRTIID